MLFRLRHLGVTRIADAPELSRARGGRRASARRRTWTRTWQPLACAGTPEQGSYLRQLYRVLNEDRFGGRLPADLHLRLSRRMSSRLGHASSRPGPDGTRTPLEIALNLDLLLEGNEAHLLDTMLHEMAHVEDAMESGGRAHGASWKRIARRVGCAPRACTKARVIRRSARGEAVTRVPEPPVLARTTA